MTASTVDITTYSDADFAFAFQWVLGGVPFDFTNHGLMMHVRKQPDDVEVFINLSSQEGEHGEAGGIMFTPDPLDGNKLKTFTIVILRDQMIRMEPGAYVHSLILIRPDGLRDDIWRGTLTHAIGATRGEGPAVAEGIV